MSIVERNALVGYQPKAVRVHLGGDLAVHKGLRRHICVVPNDVLGCVVVMVIGQSVSQSEIRHLPPEMNIIPE